MKQFWTILLSCQILFSSCASILNGSSQKVKVVSPTNCQTYLNGKQVYLQAGYLTLSRNMIPQQFTFKREGYLDENKVAIQYKKSPLAVLSIIPFGVFVYPIFLDNGKKAYNYEKVISLVNQDYKVPSFGRFKLFPKFNQFELSEDMEFYNFNSYRSYYYFKTSDFQPTHYSVSLKRNELLTQLYFQEKLEVLINEKEYVRSSSLNLDKFKTELKIDVRLLDLELSEINTSSSYNGGFTQVKIELLWLLQDVYGNKLEEVTTFDSSGEFKFHNKKDYDQSVQSAIEDCLHKGYITFLNNEKVGNLMLNGFETKEVNFPLLLLNDSRAANTLKKAINSVVTVKLEEGHGSGVFISNDGYLVTNYHVVQNNKKVKIIDNSGKEYWAEVIRINKTKDLALLKADTEVEPIRFSMSPLQITQEVYAIGTPASTNLSQTVSRGIVSRIEKNDSKNKFVQFDASINSGNSGGALLNNKGELVGIVNAKLTGKGIEGIGFAIAIDQVYKGLSLNFAGVNKP
ncbi:Trypsin-like peptidase domain-containing protein [Spirosomataceae bacterium TFI 002]|nr:Trypsin-like peptidase domain-containing protein [Spirosomataceae bacterium TFI 002]